MICCIGFIFNIGLFLVFLNTKYDTTIPHPSYLISLQSIQSKKSEVKRTIYIYALSERFMSIIIIWLDYFLKDLP